MFEPIPFENQSGINLDLLMFQIDRRIQKITWMVTKKKRRRNKLKKGNKSQSHGIVDIAVQTGQELLQSQSNQLSLTCSQFKLESSDHTKACSIVGVNTQLRNAIFGIEGRNIQESITQSRQGFSISPRGSRTAQNDAQTSLAIEIQSVKITQRQKTQESQEDACQKKMNRVASFGSQDSLYQNSCKKRIEESIDSKFFSEQNIHQSTSSQIEEISQLKLKFNRSPPSLEKKSKENDASRSKSKNNTKNSKSRKSITSGEFKSANYLKSTKNFKQTKNVAKEEKKVSNAISRKKITTQKALKSNEADALAKTAVFNKKDSLQKPFRSTSFIPRVSKGQTINKNSIIPIQRKNSDRSSVQERNYQKVTVTFQTKTRMKELVRSIQPRVRKQGNDGTVRANLLKRIEEKMTNNIA